jgi:hypothetical protein
MPLSWAKTELEESNNKLEEEKLKNEYLSAQINVHTNSHNIGEKDEVLSILKLFYYNKSNQYDKLIEIFGDEACEGISIIDETGCVITDINTINKAKGCLKADVIIKMNKTTKIYTASIKSKNGANPAILNHTPRSAKIFNIGCFVIKSKLIEGNYPDYNKVFPDSLPNKLLVDKETLRAALQRVSILTNDQFKGVKLLIDKAELKLTTNNPSQEEGEDIIIKVIGSRYQLNDDNISILGELCKTKRDKKGNKQLNTTGSCQVPSDKN